MTNSERIAKVQQLLQEQRELEDRIDAIQKGMGLLKDFPEEIQGQELAKAQKRLKEIQEELKTCKKKEK